MTTDNNTHLKIPLACHFLTTLTQKNKIRMSILFRRGERVLAHTNETDSNLSFVSLGITFWLGNAKNESKNEFQGKNRCNISGIYKWRSIYQTNWVRIQTCHFSHATFYLFLDNVIKLAGKYLHLCYKYLPLHYHKLIPPRRGRTRKRSMLRSSRSCPQRVIYLVVPIIKRYLYRLSYKR